MKKIIFLLSFLFCLSTLFPSTSYSIEFSRAYFKVKDFNNLSFISAYIHHDFGDGIFSIEAPDFLIEKLSKNSSLEFRGYASLWQISAPKFNLASCSPSQIPWGISKVNGGVGGEGMKLAIVDTGVNINHPDLKANVVDCVDAQSSVLRKSCSDGNGHGTHVAGTVSANGKIKGVAPSSKILAIKVCSDRGYCWSDDVARGIKYAADKGANIVNLSLGGSSLSKDEKTSIDYAINKGVLIVAAAGNSGSGDNTIKYPAAYEKVVAVGAIDLGDKIASFSSRGNNYKTTPYVVEERDIELVAPGVSIESTAKNGCYAIYSGTSMASPHIAGLAAKLWQGSALSTRLYLQERARNNYLDLGRVGDDPDAGYGLPTAP